MARTLTRALAPPAAAAIVCLAPAALADVEPDWIAGLPAGAALTAGLNGMIVDAGGTSYATGVMGPSSNTDAVTFAFGPDGAPLWQHVFNGPGNWHDQGRAIAFGPGGVIYVAGSTPVSFSQLLLLKYDAATGALLDSVQYSSAPGTSEFGGTVATDAAGNVYVGGGTVGDGGDGLLVSFDAAGGLRWQRTWDGPALAPYSQDQVVQVLVDPGGDVIALIHGVMSSQHADYVVIKYAPGDGSIIWQAVWGAAGDDSAREMEIDAAGDLYVTGTGLDFIDRFATIKLRGSDGALLWHAYDSIGARAYASRLALDGQGGVYVTGGSDPEGDQSNLNDNFYTVKRDADDGALRWTHFYGLDCIGCFDVPADVIVDSAAHAFVVGRTNSPPYSSDMLLFVLDAETGAETARGIVESAPAGGFAEPRVLRLDASGDLFAGADFYDPGTGSVDMTVVKFPSMAGPGADIDGDGVVGISDLLAVLGDWGACAAPPAPCPADIDASGDVGIGDLLLVLANWG